MLKKLIHATLLTLLLFSYTTIGFSQNSQTVISRYFQEHASEWNVLPADIQSFQILSEAPSSAKGVTHTYIRQLFNGIPVYNGLATVTLRNNQVLHVASRLKGNLSASEKQPVLSVFAAIQKASSGLQLAPAQSFETLEDAHSYIRLSVPEWSDSPIDANLVYVASDKGVLQLAWHVAILSKDSQHWWSARISATTGNLIDYNDWITHCEHTSECIENNTEENTTHSHLASPPPPPPGQDQYLVYALPVESPAHGDRSIVMNPSDPVASPYGWHDTDGVPGDEFTTTRGNNVLATEDANNDDLPGYFPDGGNTLNFVYPYDSAVGVQGNLDAVITNLFYMNNKMHDIWSAYGFDEASGNFQQTNYSGAGEGNDYVLAEAQDGSGTNNANFGTPPEGFNPRMQMYLWSYGNNAPNLLTINSPETIAQEYQAVAASFGPPVPTTPLTADLVIANDGSSDISDACQSILSVNDMNGKIAIVRRGNCTFEQKVENCQAAGAVAVIVVNNVITSPISMTGSTGGALIPSLMVSQVNGNLFIDAINNGATVNGTLMNQANLLAADSDFDNGIIAHEYGHGISNRLTGGAANTDCLWNDEQMGEGWSDWFGLMLTMETGDQGSDVRGVGTYVIDQPTNGNGIRPAPYSTDFTKNAYTYGATNSNSLSKPHGIGFVWATVLWDLNWALIDRYGFDPDVQNGTGGNNKAMALVIEGLKLQPCTPGFIDGRDAILLADELLYNGANKCLIWEVFARRGLGYSADQGSSLDRTDQIEAFDLPNSCAQGLAENGLDLIHIHPNPAKDVIVIDMKDYNQVSSIRITDIQGKTVYEKDNVNTSEITVNIAGFKSGLYLVQLTDSYGARSIAIVKQE